MIKKELAARLVAERVPAIYYSLDGGHPSERLCLRHIANEWQVYYSERGEETGLMTFGAEEEACDYFYCALKEAWGL